MHVLEENMEADKTGDRQNSNEMSPRYLHRTAGSLYYQVSCQ